MSSAPRPRPKYYDLNLAHLPAPGLVSILHRISGLVLFFPVIPALLFLLQEALGTAVGYNDFREFFSRPPVKLVTLAVVWAYAHHFWAGLRFLLLDLHWHIAKAPAQRAALVVLVLGIVTTVLVAWRLW
jgi:succinate dehydrogenase / fumarate reductase cytochrome b subunit